MNKHLALILILTIILFTVVPIVNASTITLMDSNGAANYTATAGIAAGAGSGVGIDATGNGQFLHSVSWWIRNGSTASVTGTLRTYVYQDITGSAPTNTSIAMSDALSLADINWPANSASISAHVKVTFNFTDTLQLTNGVSYFFGLVQDTDPSGQVAVAQGGTSNRIYRTGWVTWTEGSGTHFLYEIYTSDAYDAYAVTLDEYWQFSNSTAVPRYTTDVDNASWSSTLIQEDTHTYLGHVWNVSVPYSNGNWYAYKSTNHFDNESVINIVDSQLTLYDSGSVSNGFFMFTYEPTDIDGDDYWEGWIINGTLDDNDGSFTSTFVTKADNPVTVPNPLPTDGSYTYDSTNDLIDTLGGYLVPLLTFLIPALILGYVTHWEKWPILIGLAIGSGLTYLFLGTQYLWLVVMVIIGIASMSYSSFRGRDT